MIDARRLSRRVGSIRKLVESTGDTHRGDAVSSAQPPPETHVTGGRDDWRQQSLSDFLGTSYLRRGDARTGE
ncbi:MAG: hypothetical protein KDA96_11870 [Planctomycetaceae bacterium]|nr:hypothetical protein [Planctomycetaceae bacterium]